MGGGAPSLSNSSAAQSGADANQSFGGFYGGAVNFAPPPNNTMIYAALALLGAVLWLKR